MIYNNKFIPVQFGNYVFRRTEFSSKESTPVKTLLDNTAYTDGKIRANQFNRNYKEDKTYEVEFLVSNKENLHAIKKLLLGPPQKMFFIERFEYKPIAGKNADGLEDYKVYFNYAEAISQPTYIDSTNNEFGEEFDQYKLTFRLINPFNYECAGKELKFISQSELNKLSNTSWQSNSLVWEGNVGRWADGLSSADFFNFNEQDAATRRRWFSDCLQPKGLFLYKDLFFARELTQIDTSNLTVNGVFQADLAIGEGFNDPKVFDTQAMKLLTSANNDVMVIEIENINPSNGGQNARALLENQSIEIVNLSDSSGFKLTWIDGRCPKKLSLYLHKSEVLYNYDTGAPISIYDPFSQYYKSAKYEFIGNKATLLDFEGLLQVDERLTRPEKGCFFIKRNFDSTTARNTRITIQNLPKYH